MKIDKASWWYRTTKSLYHSYIPFLWRERIDVRISGHSLLYKPVFKEVGGIFIHVPKAAGISISRSLYGISTGHYTAQTYKRISAKEFSKYFKFAFVRNPWDRAVSAYTFVKQGGTKFVQPTKSDIYASGIFDDFDTFLFDWLQYQNLLEIDVVFAPQYHFICDDDDQLLVDYVGKMETLESDIIKISEKLGRPIDIKHLNKSTKQKDFRSYYSDKSIELVAKIYQKDIDMFNYSFDD